MKVKIGSKHKYSKLEKLIIMALSFYVITLYIFIEEGETFLVSKAAFAITFILMLINIIIKAHKSQSRNILISPAIISFAIFVMLCFMSVLWSPLPSISLSMSLTMIQLLLMVIVFYYGLRGFGNAELFIKIISFSGIVMSAYLIWYYSLESYIDAIMSNSRIGRDFANVNSIGGAAAMTLIGCVYLLIFKRKLIYLPLSILPSLVLLGAGSRTAIAVALSGITLLFINNSLYIQKDKKILRVLYLVLYLMIGYIVAINISNISILNSVRERFDILFQVLKGDNSYSGSVVYRMGMARVGWSLFTESPILGNGINATRLALYSNGIPYTYLHNNYLEIMADLGILGLCSYYYIYSYILKKLIKQRRVNDSYSFFIALLFSMLVLDIGGITYYMQRNYVFLVFTLIVATQTSKEHYNHELYKNDNGGRG